MEKGIKEIKELLAAVEVVGTAVKKISKDGKVDLTDAVYLVELGTKLNVLVAAAEGIKEIPAEAKDIQADEAIELVGTMYQIAKKIQEA